MRTWKIALLLTGSLSAAQVWTVRVEEPTGLYPREREVVAVPLMKVGGRAAGFRVVGPDGIEAPWQVAGGDLLFPVSVMPGALPEYRVTCCAGAANFRNEILLRRLGKTRVEFGNSRFRALVDLEAGAITEVYHLGAGPQRSLNLVETTPEGPDALKGDVHESTPDARTFSPPPVAGVSGANMGWSSLGGNNPFTGVELAESGPLRGRMRLTRAGEVWEITWTAAAPWFRWKAQRGFRFAAISATPYRPFDRCLDGSEYRYPTGPGEEEPSPHDVEPRGWRELPGGHMVYYQRAENYGALGLVALDGALRWTGACSRRVVADRGSGSTDIAVTFPEWKGAETVLDARRVNRMVRQPVLVQVAGPAQGAVEVRAAVERAAAAEERTASPTYFRNVRIWLDGEWELAFSEKGQGPPAAGWRKVKVPGAVHTQWLDASKVYTRDAEWVSYKEWWYRRTVTVPPEFHGRKFRLQFEATDYYADVYWNGKWIGRHEGYIDPHEYEVEDNLDNKLMVRVWTPVSYYWKHRPYTIKGAYGAVDQKPDDITPLGITRSVWLVPTTGAIIRDVATATRLRGADADLELQLQADGLQPGYRWEVTLADTRQQVRTPADAPSTTVTMHVKQPRLWWPRGHGPANLYTLEVRLLDSAGRAVDAWSQKVGFREIERIGWNFYVNGRHLFIRGTNYYSHLFMADMNRDKYQRDLKLMLGMNINMIRLHCHFTNREFYDLADENGVLIWQDFLEAWYPHDRRFAQRASELYDNHIRYVRNHASVALWATSDEEDFENYHEITKHLAARASLLDPQRRPVVRSTGRFGDSHVYHGWYDGSIWEYTQMKERFVSELGATSLPNYETLVKYMPGLWPIRDHEDEWTWRRLQIPEAMKAWGDPGDMSLRDYIPRTQAYVSRLFQIAIERMRRRKADGAGGILHFHAIDIWPSVTMAAIDFDRVPTAVYDTVRRSFEPVAALFEYDRDRWKPDETVRCGLWGVNDLWKPVPNAKLRWWVKEIATARGEFALSLSEDSVLKAGEAVFPAPGSGPHELHAQIVGNDGRVISENVFRFEVDR